MLDLLQTEIAIKFTKDTFEQILAKRLKLTRVSAPLFVYKESGLNDDLSGVENPVNFYVPSLDKNVEIVHSLAKWKRNALLRYGFNMHEGLYTDMNAIRKDEKLDAIHSIYVDQWDWERVIAKNERNYTTLKKVVKTIYKALLETEKKINAKFPTLKKKLADDITFISSSELLNKYPNMTAKERENAACKEYGSVFVYQIGWPLKNKEAHDLRAADYDDWKLNGDILVYDEAINSALELSSMGIRVDAKSLVKQIKFKHEEYKLDNPYSKSVLNETLPFTIGGGIGQSRLCMFFLEKKHIGEVQCSLWPEANLEGLDIL